MLYRVMCGKGNGCLYVCLKTALTAYRMLRHTKIFARYISSNKTTHLLLLLALLISHRHLTSSWECGRVAGARGFWNTAANIVHFISPSTASSATSDKVPPGKVNIEKCPNVAMEDLVSLCKRRGFVYPSSELYNGFQGFFDYGPLGVELKKNIKDRWWRDIVQSRQDIVGLDASIIASPRIWEASGHVTGFCDPMIDCKESKLRFRADQVYFSPVIMDDGDVLGFVSIQESENMEMEAQAKADELKQKSRKQGKLEPLNLKDLTEASMEQLTQIPSPATGVAGSLTPPRDFNLMFSTSVGAMTDASSIAYIRPETAQGIFTNFKHVQQTSRMKLPFGIAQIGKAFRNEISPRNFIFRSREFEQMEIEYFIDDDEHGWQEHHNEWLESSWEWLKSIGLREELMGRDIHMKDKLAHYARACTDITFRYPFGESELQGVAARGSFDLKQHQETSGKSQEYYDESSKRKFIPHVIEPSLGVDRLFLALLVSAYTTDTVAGEKRTLIRLHPSMAPIKCGVFPLMKNDAEQLSRSKQLYSKLCRRFNCVWDASGAIGRRYRRMDEAGTPFCVTIDFDSFHDGMATVRHRDSTEQIRMPIDHVENYIDRAICGD